MKFLKALWTVTKWITVVGVLSAIWFSFGFIVRPEVFPHLPSEVQQIAGEEQSHKSTIPFEEYDNVMLVGIFDGFIADIDPEDYKALMSKDLKWLISCKFNARVRSDLPINGTMDWHIGAYDENTPRKESQTYMTKMGPITQLKIALPAGDGMAYFVSLQLANAEEFKVKIIPNEMPSADQAPKEKPKADPPKNDGSKEDSDEF